MQIGYKRKHINKLRTATRSTKKRRSEIDIQNDRFPRAIPSSVCTGSSSFSSTPLKPLKTTPSISASTNNHEIHLVKSLFEDEESVDEYFFNNPASKWSDIGAYCKTALENSFKMPCKSAFRTYKTSLLNIKRNAGANQILKTRAGELLRIREFYFRSQYFIEEANVVKILQGSSKQPKTNNDTEGSNYYLQIPPLDNPLHSDVEDDDYNSPSPSSQGSSEIL
ncbi:hypothetical protein BGX27_002960 [Mortierella sp. AM989]|nr:hypothetical protein BGX27_002960 [Mortierella sp. AM989]